MVVKTRFAPSPTGYLHLGGVYGALIDYAFAKKNKGDFILRIEDTDKKRYVEDADKVIFEGLKWLGLNYNKGPFYQSERLAVYKEHALKLVEKGYAYYCFCSSEKLEQAREHCRDEKTPPRYDRCCRNLDPKEVDKKLAGGEKYVIRMKIPDNETIVVNDLIRGKIEFDSNLLDDQILIKSDGFPTYHLASTVDDHLMAITHVIRGEEWLSSAPKHVLLYRYFGWKMPIFFHTPVLRNPDKSKLSKRKGHTALSWYKEEGFLPEAILNFLALLGWSHPQGKEIFDLDEFIKCFDLTDFSPIGPVFDIAKLEWMNGVYLRLKSDKELAELLQPFLPEVSFDQILKVAPLIKERIKKLSEAKGLLEFIWSCPVCPVCEVAEKIDKALIREMISQMVPVFEKEGVEKVDKIQKIFLGIIQKRNWKVGDFFMVLRVAVCGKKITPPILESLSLIGKEETIKRLKLALER